MLGSFTESLVNKAIEMYEIKELAIFRKSYVCSSFNKFSKPLLIKKGDVDYYGIYKGKYVCFEVKETIKHYWDLSRLKTHQFEIIKKVNELGGISFLLLNFVSQNNSVFIFFLEDLKNLINRSKKRVSIQDAEIYGRKVNIEFPGYIDFLSSI